MYMYVESHHKLGSEIRARSKRRPPISCERPATKHTVYFSAYVDSICDYECKREHSLVELLEDGQGFNPQNVPERFQYFVDKLF
jgi:hypothetical protein